MCGIVIHSICACLCVSACLVCDMYVHVYDIFVYFVCMYLHVCVCIHALCVHMCVFSGMCIVVFVVFNVWCVCV